jgi:hypothetical protein
VCAGEPVSAAEKIVASDTGLTRERRLPITSEPPKRAEERKNESERLDRHIRTLTTAKTWAYSEFPKEPLTIGDKTEIREQVDALIDYCGKVAIKNQPDFKP